MIRKETDLFEIEKIALILTRLLGLKKQGDVAMAHELTAEALDRYFQLSINGIDNLSPELLVNALKDKKYLSEKLDLLAQLIFESAHPFQDLPAVHNKLHLVLAIFNYMESEYHIQSLNNLARREMIDKFLNNQQYE